MIDFNKAKDVELKPTWYRCSKCGDITLFSWEMPADWPCYPANGKKCSGTLEVYEKPLLEFDST